MNKILENLYLGDRTAAESIDALNRCGITHIVNLTENVVCKFASRVEYF
jgi:protein-tyrosine phosphatase